jgi:phytoene dehydrogenase-like protein
MNVALASLPVFSALPAPGPHHSSGIIMAPSLAYMERAYFDARTSGWSREPIVEMLIPSTVDDTLAPPGQHVASLFCQHVHPDLAAVQPGRTWDDAREEVADLMIATVDRAAPGFRASAAGTKIPFAASTSSGSSGSSAATSFHGALSLDQLFSARPVLATRAIACPSKVLYLCGSGAHPGGGCDGFRAATQRARS